MLTLVQLYHRGLEHSTKIQSNLRLLDTINGVELSQKRSNFELKVSKTEGKDLSHNLKRSKIGLNSQEWKIHAKLDKA